MKPEKKNRTAIKIQKLLQELRTLKKQYKVASEDKHQPQAELQEIHSKKLTMILESRTVQKMSEGTSQEVNIVHCQPAYIKIAQCGGATVSAKQVILTPSFTIP